MVQEPGKDSARSRARRERILQAAQVVLSRRGLEGTTVNHLIAEADISRATFYRAFGSLEEVVEALYDAYEEHVLERLKQALQNPDDPQWLEHLVGAVLRDASQMGPFVAVLFAEELRPGSKAKRHQQRRVRNQVELIGRWWEERTGTPPDPALILCFVAMLQSLGLYLGSARRTKAERDALEAAAVTVVRATTEAYRSAKARG